MARKAQASREPVAGKPKVSSDAYVGILAVSLLLQITGAVFLYLDWSQYPTTVPPKPPALGAGTGAGAGAAPPAVLPKGPPAGGPPAGGPPAGGPPAGAPPAKLP
jgi:hypothetical protein